MFWMILFVIYEKILYDIILVDSYSKSFSIWFWWHKFHSILQLNTVSMYIIYPVESFYFVLFSFGNYLFCCLYQTANVLLFAISNCMKLYTPRYYEAWKWQKIRLRFSKICYRILYLFALTSSFLMFPCAQFCNLGFHE